MFNVGLDKPYIAKTEPRTSSFSGRKHTPEAIELLRAHALARTTLHKPGYALTITDLHTGITVTPNNT